MQSERNANGPETLEGWDSVDWQKTYRIVNNLRQRIFRATRENDLRKVRSLQKLMLRSRHNVLESVRRVTQTNAGKNTPGVDHLVVKTPEARWELVARLCANELWESKPVRRVYIPKSNGKLRPLGIPTVFDRCLQAMVKNALEPEWEARFEGTSYGFRPGRSCHDAIAKIYSLARPNKRKKWIVDADIKGAFDNINHDFLMEAIGQFPAKEMIFQWLKAGVMEEGVFYDTITGTPQGGVISPLLLNIALHGMETALGVKYNSKGETCGKRAVVRYADDFVVFCESQEDAEIVRGEVLPAWLKQRGLALSEEKTRIVCLTGGFDFLGFNIKHYYTPKTTRTGLKLLIKPSKKSVQGIRDKLKATWLSLKGKSIHLVLKTINPIITGMANYHRKVVSSNVFRKLDHWMFLRQYRYGRHTHPQKSWWWIKQRYFGKLNSERNDIWVFGTKHQDKTHYLKKFSWFKIERHVLVQGTSSPDDPFLRIYWRNRRKLFAIDLNRPSDIKIADAQDWTCPICDQPLGNGERIELDHRIEKVDGGKDQYTNLVWLHSYCHQQKTAEQRKLRAKRKRIG